MQSDLRSFACRAVVLMCAVLAVVNGPARAETAQRPNIVWVFIEDMNAWLGCYGDDTVPTPGLDALAERGVRFDRAYMPSGICSATRSAIALGAMQTSLGAHNHRSSNRSVPDDEVFLPDGVKTVYELMREAGYHVTTQGMDKNDFNFIFNRKNLYNRWSRKMLPALWSGREEGQPFFAQFQLAGGKNSGKGVPQTDPAGVDVAPYYPDVPVMRDEYAHHYDCIRQTDNEVGRILGALEKDGVLDDTVVFVFSDHGMRLYRHKQWLYEGGIRVPLIVAGPGVDRGESRDDLVSGIDITAATLALGGVDPAGLSWVEGRDFFADDHEPREYVISARDRCGNAIDRVRAVTTDRYKYIRNFMTDRPFMQPHYRDGRDYVEVPRELHARGKLTPPQAFVWSETRVPEELYDLDNDPHEIDNLADDPGHADVLAEHRAILERWIARTDDKGQYPEPEGTLRGALKRKGSKCVNPEYDRVRNGG